MSLLAFIPGFGPILAGVSAVLGYIVRCMACMVMIAIGVSWIAGDIHGSRKQIAVCAANDKAEELKAAQRDLQLQKDAAAFAQGQADDLTKSNADLQQKVKVYETTLKGPGCILSGDDLKRLRDIGKP